jgi:hypothetical protein
MILIGNTEEIEFAAGIDASIRPRIFQYAVAQKEIDQFVDRRARRADLRGDIVRLRGFAASRVLRRKSRISEARSNPRDLFAVESSAIMSISSPLLLIAQKHSIQRSFSVAWDMSVARIGDIDAMRLAWSGNANSSAPLDYLC